MTILFSNNAQSTLAANISNTATALAVAAGTGGEYPNPSPGDIFYITLTDAATRTNNEIMICTARAGDTLTVLRGQEGTAAQNWIAGDIVTNRWTAAQAAAMLQQGQYQSQAANWAVDVGAANAYQCTLNPPITVPVEGMPIRLLVANTNTTVSTFNPGSGAGAIRRRDGSALIGGEMIAGNFTELMWTGSYYEIMSGPAPASNAVALAQSDGQSFISPLGLVNAFPFSFGSTGYLILPGPVGVRPVFEWGQTVVNTGTAAPVVFPLALTGGLLSVQISINFVVNFPPSGIHSITGGGTTGFTLNNQTGANGNFFWFAFGRA